MSNLFWTKFQFSISIKGMGMSKRDVSSDINLSPVQLINVALLDYMNNMGVVSLKNNSFENSFIFLRIDEVWQREIMERLLV